MLCKTRNFVLNSRDTGASSVILNKSFLNPYQWLISWVFKWNLPQLNTKQRHWWLVNMGLNNGLLPPRNKPLSQGWTSSMVVYRVSRPQWVKHILWFCCNAIVLKTSSEHRLACLYNILHYQSKCTVLWYYQTSTSHYAGFRLWNSFELKWKFTHFFSTDSRLNKVRGVIWRQ